MVGTAVRSKGTDDGLNWTVSVNSTVVRARAAL